MIKKALTFCFVLLSLSALILAQPELPLISDIYLIKSQAEISSIPALIRIGLEMTSNAYYKLSQEGVIITAGLFPKGFNSISIPTASLLEQPGEHVYILELKTESRLYQREIVLDVQIETEDPQKKTETKPQILEHKLSLYVDDQLVASLIKTQDKKIPVKTESPPLPKNYDPFNPDQLDNPLANSVSILQAVGLAYYLIKELTKKKDEGNRVPPIQKSSLITFTFNKKDTQGMEQEFKALIRLRMRNP